MVSWFLSVVLAWSLLWFTGVIQLRIYSHQFAINQKELAYG